MIKNRNIDFKNLIKELKTTNNLTQKQMSDMLHVSRQCISHWEIGTRIPDIYMLDKISKEFNIPIFNHNVDENYCHLVDKNTCCIL